MRQVIILAAGKGSRLSKYTKNMPKALLPIKYGQSILERMLHQLQDNGIQELIVVVGYKADNTIKRIEELSNGFPNINIRIVVNDQYETSGTLKSLLIGMKEIKNIDEDILVVEGDVVCDDYIIEDIVKNGSNTVLGDSSRILDEEAMKYNLDKSDYINKISKELSVKRSVGEVVGIIRINFSEKQKFIEESHRIYEYNNYAFYEEVINTGVMKFNVIDISPHNWTEVDFPSDYKKARQIFAEIEKIKIDDSLFEETSHSPSIFSLVKNLDIEIKDFCFLANPYLLNDIFIEEISIELKQLFSTYPPLQNQLSKTVSKFHDGNIASENIAVGNGATELIDIINYSSEGSIVPIPTFSEYIDSAKNLITYQLYEKNNFSLDISAFIEFCKKQDANKHSNIVLINPNNPIGRLYKRSEVENVLSEIKNFNIIVDESFIDFSDSSQSVLDLITRYNNLIVVKSFGKTLGMPGVRVGSIYSNADYINKIKQKIPVWNVNCIASHILEIMSNNQFKERLYLSISKVKNDTNQLYADLTTIGTLKVFEPHGNFVMVKILNGMMGKELRDILLKDGIFVRDCTNKVGLGPEYVRIASRTKRENKDIAKHIEMILIDYDTN